MTSKHNPLFEALDTAGFVYSVRQSAGGSEYAGFRWQCSSSQALRSFTALLEANALRLTLYEPLGPGGGLDERACLTRQRDFPVSRLYNNQDRLKKLELTIAIQLDGADLNVATLMTLLSHLASNADDLNGIPSGMSRQAPSLGRSMADVSLIDTLRDLGLRPRKEGGAFSVDMALPGLAVGARLSVYHLGVGWIRVSAHLSQVDTLALERLSPDLCSRLQLWAPVGRFVSVAVLGKPHFGCEVATPNLAGRASETIANSMRSAVRMLGTAYQQAR